MTRNTLSPREQQILALIGAGRTTRQIAAALRLAVDTVKRHRQRISRKLRRHRHCALVLVTASRTRTDSTPGESAP